MQCPKCGYTRTQHDDLNTPDYECPECGIVYHKYLAHQAAIAKAAEPPPPKLKPQQKPKPSQSPTNPDPWQETIERIAQETDDDRFLTRKELKYLPSILSDDETLIAFSSGLMNNKSWLIALTDHRILFVDVGLFYGVHHASIDLDKINTVSCDTGLIFGSIVIQDGAHSRAITNVLKRTVLPFTNKVRDAIAARKNQDQPAQKLQKLNKLLDQNLITQQEYDAKRQKILENI